MINNLPTQDIDKVDFELGSSPLENHNGTEGSSTLLNDRCSGPRESMECNIQFSRTLSVGRLHDRVLSRSCLPNLSFCPLEQEREVRYAIQGLKLG
ncbi:hypothetical protein AgCh_003337 [Apium graveolens]